MCRAFTVLCGERNGFRSRRLILDRTRLRGLTRQGARRGARGPLLGHKQRAPACSHGQRCTKKPSLPHRGMFRSVTAGIGFTERRPPVPGESLLCRVKGADPRSAYRHRSIAMSQVNDSQSERVPVKTIIGGQNAPAGTWGNEARWALGGPLRGMTPSSGPPTTPGCFRSVGIGLTERRLDHAGRNAHTSPAALDHAGRNAHAGSLGASPAAPPVPGDLPVKGVNPRSGYRQCRD
jgi:hypothetical protein